MLEGLAEVDIAKGKAKLGDLEKKAGAAAKAEIDLQITALQGDVSGCASRAESEHGLCVSSLGGGSAIWRLDGGVAQGFVTPVVHNMSFMPSRTLASA